MSDVSYSGPLNEWMAQAPPQPAPKVFGKSAAKLLEPYLSDPEQAQAAAEAAAARVRAPYAKANERVSGLPDVGTVLGNKLVNTLMAGPNLMGQVAEGSVDPNSPEAIRRSADVAASTLGYGMMGARPGAAGMAGGRLVQPSSLPVRAASEDLHEVAAANFTHGLPIGNKTVPIDSLGGGVSSSPTEVGRVQKLVEQMGGPDGYIRRLITDDAGNVVEGQHRLEALRQLGVKNVPVSVIKDLGRDFDTEAMQGAVKDAGIRHPDQVHGMVRSALEALHETGGDPAKALSEYEMPSQFQKPFEAALNAAKPKTGSLPPGATPGMLHLHSQIANLGPEWQNVPVINHTGAVIHNPIDAQHVNGPMLMMDKEGNLTPGILAYHGSPHDFDRFDLSKIGTGEGAQAYGHGLYFAENEGVAKQYRDTLGMNNKRWTVDDKVVGQYGQNGTPEGSAAAHLRQVMGENRKVTQADADAALAKFNSVHERNPGMLPKAQLDATRKSFGDLVGKTVGEQDAGKMYQVAIKAPPEHFLDWDRPLSEQSPKVQEAIKKLPLSESDMKDILGDKGFSGMHLVQAMNWHPSVAEGSADRTTAALREAGIPGIKYMDQGSRGHTVTLSTAKGGEYSKRTFPTREQADQYASDKTKEGFQAKTAQEGTRNFVVFDHNLIDILKKYGIAGVGALPAMNAYHFQKSDTGS